MARLRGLRRSGQAAVLVGLVLFTLVIFMALATNMGILVNDRIRMQNAVDLSAYAGAYKEAQELNDLVTYNQDILDVVKECREILTQPEQGYWDGYYCECVNQGPIPEQIIQICQEVLDQVALLFVLRAHYGLTVSPAVSAGKATLEANIANLGQKGHMFEGVNTSASRSGNYTTVGPYGGQYPTIANYVRESQTKFNYPVMLYCPCGVSCCPSGVVPSIDYYVNSWYYKDDTNPDIWIASYAKATPANRYLDIAYSSSGNDGGYFGSSSDGGQDDNITAVGIAKPFDGSVGPTAIRRIFGSEYGAGNNRESPYYTSFGLEAPEEAMFANYRARLAGKNEWNARPADWNPSSALTEVIGAEATAMFMH